MTGATTLSIDQGVGTVTGSSVTVSPTATTTYTLTAANAAGLDAKSVTVTVAAPGAPLIQSFSALPAAISAGASSTLSWSVTGATSVSIDNLVGAVAAAGTASVTPPVTTTYTLAAANDAGTTTASTTVTVSGSSYIAPSPVSGDVVVSTDTHVLTPISPYIYGLNFAEFGGPGLPGNWGDNWGSFLPRYSLNRFGGNRLSGHSFETGYSNCGSDCGSSFPNDDCSSTPTISPGGWTRAIPPRRAIR